MKYFTKSSLFFIVTIILLIACKTQSGKVNAPEKQLAEIMEMWPGTYNNNKQIATVEREGGAVWRADDSGEGGYLNVYSHYIKMEMPEVGDHVLYVEEYRDGDPEVTYRQRIYTLSVDETAGIVKVKMWPFKDKKKYIGAFRKPNLLSQISKEEISAYPDKCDLLVKLMGNKYHMYMNGQDCAFGDKVFNYEVMLSKNTFSYHDKISSLSEGKVLTSAANYAYHDLDRIK
ncbi:MAG: CpcT/CpeT family chromophore lyase [Bacteroidota bacterium]